MEKSEKISLPSTPHSSQSQQVNSHAGAESYGTPRSVQMPQSDKPVHMAISSGNFKSSSPLGHGTPSNSTSSTYQLSTSEIRSGVSSTLPSSHLGSTALPRVDRPLARLDGRLNGSLCPSQVQGHTDFLLLIVIDRKRSAQSNYFLKNFDCKVLVKSKLRFIFAITNITLPLMPVIL